AAPVHHAVPMIAGLNGDGMVAYKYHDHQRLMAENERLRSDNDRYRSEIFELKETIMQNKYSAEKAKSNNELIGMFAPVVGQIMSAKMGATMPAAPGLAAADVSPVKAQFLQAAQGFDDAFISDLSALSYLWAT